MNEIFADANVRNLILLLALTYLFAGFLILAGWRNLRSNERFTPRDADSSPGTGMDAEPEEGAFEHP